MQYLFGVFLILHGLIHASYLSPRPKLADASAWPFNLSQSWALPGVAEVVVRPVGAVLCLVTVVALVAAGLSVLGFLVLQAWWRPLTLASMTVSLLFLFLYWHPWLVVGVFLNVVILAALVWARWTPVAGLA